MAEDWWSSAVDAASTEAGQTFPDEEQRSGAMPIQWADVRSDVRSHTRSRSDEDEDSAVNDFEHFGEPADHVDLDVSEGSLRVVVAGGPIVPLVDLRAPARPSAAPEPALAPTPSGPVATAARAGRLVTWVVALGLAATAAAGLWSFGSSLGG